MLWIPRFHTAKSSNEIAVKQFYKAILAKVLGYTLQSYTYLHFFFWPMKESIYYYFLQAFLKTETKQFSLQALDKTTAFLLLQFDRYNT